VGTVEGGTVGDWAAVAKAIRQRMDARAVTQKELADKSGISTATLREMVREDATRERSAATLRKVSSALGLPQGYLLAVARHEPLPAVHEQPSETPTPGGGVADELRAIRVILERIEARLSE
jgi:transcriptional regulator with XRE-family HTH domain